MRYCFVAETVADDPQGEAQGAVAAPTNSAAQNGRPQPSSSGAPTAARASRTPRGSVAATGSLSTPTPDAAAAAASSRNPSTPSHGVAPQPQPQPRASPKSVATNSSSNTATSSSSSSASSQGRARQQSRVTGSAEDSVRRSVTFAGKLLRVVLCVCSIRSFFHQ